MIGERLEGVAALPSGLGDLLDRQVAIGPVRVAVPVTLKVTERHEVRQSTALGSLDLAGVLPQLGLDEGQVQEGVDLGLGGEGAPIGGRALQRTAIFSKPDEAVLREAPAAVARQAAEADVVGGRAREMHEVGADLAWWHDHQVDLGAAAQLDGRPLRPTAQDLADTGHGGEAPDQLTACIGLRQQVEIADRLTPAAEGAGWDEGAQAIRPDKGAHDGAQSSGRLAEPHADAPLAEAGQGVEDALLRLRTEALDAAQAPSPSGRFEVLDGGDAQRGVELVRRARAEPRHRQQVEQGRRHLGTKALVETQAARVRQLGELVRDGPSYTGQVRRLAAPIGLDDRRPRVGDGISGAPISLGLEDELALELHQVADLTEDGRQLGIGKHGHVVAPCCARALPIVGGFVGEVRFGFLAWLGHGSSVPEATSPRQRPRRHRGQRERRLRRARAGGDISVDGAGPCQAVPQPAATVERTGPGSSTTTRSRPRRLAV